jgi:hypothetical protein
MKPISIIVAIAENYAIGKDNQLLWHLPEDLKRFKRITEGHSVIMGRKTFESLPGPASDRYRDALERELSRRLGLVPALVQAGAPVDEPLRPEPDAAPRWRVAALVAAAAAALVGVLAFVQRFSGAVAVPPAVALAEVGRAQDLHQGLGVGLRPHRR